MKEPAGHMRSYLHFVLAVIVYFVARAFSSRYSLPWASETFRELAALAFFALLLWIGYTWLGRIFWREPSSLARQGWPLRTGWKGEAGLGIAFGWGLALLCVLPMLLGGGIAIVLDLRFSAWLWLLVDVVYFALLAAIEELGFRGYGFQRLADAVGPVGASVGFAAFYAIVQSWIPGATRMSLWGGILFSLLLSTACVRTRGLWVSWGINFGWKASRALLFGLAVDGANYHSHVVQGNPMTSYWLSGGGFGLEGSWVAILLLLIGWPVLLRVISQVESRTRLEEPIVAGGIPVDLMPACKTTEPKLVQILPAQSSAQESAQEQSHQLDGHQE